MKINVKQAIDYGYEPQVTVINHDTIDFCNHIRVERDDVRHGSVPDEYYVEMTVCQVCGEMWYDSEYYDADYDETDDYDDRD